MEGLYISVLFLIIITAVHSYQIQKLERELQLHITSIYAILHKRFDIKTKEVAENMAEYTKEHKNFID